MTEFNSHSRRQFVKSVGATGVVVGLAGCSGGGDSGGGSGGDSGGSSGGGSGDSGETSGGGGETTTGETAGSSSGGTLKVAATMPSPLDDFGWSQAESQSLRNVIDDLDGVELTKIVGAVSYKDTEKVIGDLARKNDVVIADSNGRLQTGTLKVSKEMSDTHFMTRNTALPPDDLPENHVTYNQHLAMVWGPMAYIAANLPDVQKIGDVDSIPVLVRAHALRGAKCAIAHEGDTELMINWINSWYNPSQTRRNAQALIDNGADAILNGVNGATPGKVAAEHDMFAIGYGIDMAQASPDGYATSVLMQPEPIFKEGIVAARDGEWADYWDRYPNHHPWAPKHYKGEGTIGLADFHDSISSDLKQKAQDYVSKVDNYEIEYPEVWKENVCPDGTEFQLDLPDQ